MEKLQVRHFLDLEYAEEELKNMISEFIMNFSYFCQKYKSVCPNVTGQSIQYFLVYYLNIVRGLCYSEDDFEHLLYVAKKMIKEKNEEMDKKK